MLHRTVPVIALCSLILLALIINTGAFYPYHNQVPNLLYMFVFICLLSVGTAGVITTIAYLIKRLIEIITKNKQRPISFNQIFFLLFILILVVITLNSFHIVKYSTSLIFIVLSFIVLVYKFWQTKYGQQRKRSQRANQSQNRK